MNFLYENFMEPCVLIERVRIPSEEGGWDIMYQEGLEFSAAVVQQSSTLAQIAEAQGVTSTYNVYTSTENALEFHDTFKRKSDGATFRVTSEEKETPDVASFSFAKVTAEKWEVPA